MGFLKDIASIGSEVDDTIRAIKGELSEGAVLKLEELRVKAHMSDSLSDSWLRKNARPITLLASAFLLGILIISDIFFNIEVDSHYLQYLIFIIGGFGGVRTFEKLKKVAK